MKALILIFAATFIGPTLPGPAIDRVDVVEANHFYGDNGQLVFDQLIFYDWCPESCRHHVRAWRLLKTDSQRPTRDCRRGGWSAIWHDGERLRVLRARSIRETWTQFDPELLERQVLPTEERRELSRD